ncbi:helix-turn-helix domain-containing protein [Cohnella sp. WQ 127256]|uniref:helix-turn-helix domain-containing protein n=1 Tax=Cohnella sp. WQ 127256 TaxID=2938790 RepID=UPI0021179746|nr:helix-turn-helix domain-containing protein [Cohnella sp. WQ 127256]
MFRIMVVEDEPLILQSICEKIRSIDLDFKIVGEYENGEYAMLELDLVKPHVLLTDVYMPVMDGLTLIEQVNKSSPSTICAILTGYRDFEYARRALQLGVTEFLLKPPQTENITKLLDDVKAKLWRNQSLMESEMLQQWAYRKEEDKVNSTNIQQLEQEYFYHANYVVLYAWNPPQMQVSLSTHEDKWKLDLLLLEGEKAYVIPPISSHQKIIVVGVHRISETRLYELAEHISSFLDAGMYCVAAADINKLQTELFPMISKLHKKVYSGFPLEGMKCLVLQGNENTYDLPMLPIPSLLEQEMSMLLVKQRKTEFLKRLEMLFDMDEWSSGTRMQWLQTLSYQMNAWILQYPEIARKSIEIHWKDELEDLIWQAPNTTAIIQSLKELHSSLFDALDQEPEVEASWTEELKNYLDTRYMDNIALTDVAERFGVNASYLGRVFKRKFGHSPIDYLIQVRLAKAKQLIREKPRLFFKDIAEMVGYNDPFYFSKLFKQWTGQTPREFKQQKMSE